MEKKIKLPLNCPSCETKLKVRTMHCDSCGTEVNGKFDLPLFTSLNSDEQEFIINFVKFSGSIKEMSKHLNLSYPSVRNLLDEIIEKIHKIEVYENK
jgi:hypothetical protein